MGFFVFDSSRIIQPSSFFENKEQNEANAIKFPSCVPFDQVRLGRRASCTGSAFSERNTQHQEVVWRCEDTRTPGQKRKEDEDDLRF